MADTLAFRWNVASGGHEQPFTPEALQTLWEHSGGVPREATILADNALLLGFFSKQKQIDRELVEKAAQDRVDSLGGKGRVHAQ